MVQPPDEPCTTGTKWATALIAFLWTALENLWSQRNQDLHGDQPFNSRAERAELEAQASAMYSRQDELLHQDRAWLFKTPLADLLTHRTSDLRAWVANTKPTLKRALNDARSRTIHNTHKITRYITVLKRRLRGPNSSRDATPSVDASPSANG